MQILNNSPNFVCRCTPWNCKLFGQQKCYLKANPSNRKQHRHCKRIGKFPVQLQFSQVFPHLHQQ